MTEPEKPTPFICVQCGTQFTEGSEPPSACPICQDERQFIRWEGQAWTTMEQLAEEFRIVIQDDAGLTGLGMEPRFAIGQRALLVPTERSNILWDCIPLLDQTTVEEIQSRGGIRAIAISHPHYYAAMVEWSEAFGGVPIYLHEDDRKWVMRLHETIQFWKGDALPLGDGLTLHRLGGHFPGGTILHHARGPKGAGALLTGDILQVVPDRRWVGFMFSYPNLIPLPPQTVLRMADWVSKLDFDRIYGAWWGRNVLRDGKEAVVRSARRYVKALNLTTK
jgi:hypothetical protein